MLVNNTAETESLMVVAVLECGFMTIGRILNANLTQRKHPAQGVHEVGANIPFHFLATNFSKTSVIIQRHRYVAIGAVPLESVVAPEQNDGLGPAMEVNPVHYKEVKICRHK